MTGEIDLQALGLDGAIEETSRRLTAHLVMRRAAIRQQLEREGVTSASAEALLDLQRAVDDAWLVEQLADLRVELATDTGWRYRAH